MQTTTPQPSRPLCIVFGARTRLGQAWLKSTAVAKFDRILIARHTEDAAALNADFPDTPVRLVSSNNNWPKGYNRIVVCGCAFGMIHPQSSDWTHEHTTAGRDLATIQAIFHAYAQHPLRLVYVSSILALSSRGTPWYGGWKNVIEGSLINTVTRHGNATLSVLYPGRLTNSKSLASPVSLLSTRFDVLADKITQLIESPTPHRRIVGADAYLWLAARGLPTWLINLDKRH